MALSKNRFNPFSKFAYFAALVALAGLVDAVYLTIHHYTAEPVPCSIVAGCETVLTSAYATLGGIPLGIFGAAAYFFAFVLSVLTIFDKVKAWLFYGMLTVSMMLFTLWLLYLQAFVLGAFCQFCLLSAASSFTLFITAVISKFWRAR